MGCRSALAIALIVAATTADAQDVRRRPGEPPPARRYLPPPVTPPKARPAPPARPSIPTELRRRPGLGEAQGVPAAPFARLDDDARRRPGQPKGTSEIRRPFEPNRRSGLTAVAKPGADAEYRKETVEDRWQLTRRLGLTDYPWYDPYNQNTLKADRPVFGDQWFFNLQIVSDTVIEPRRLPTPVSPQGEGGAGNSDLIGDGTQVLASQNIGVGLVLYKGNTTFMPPDWEFRFTPVLNATRADVEQFRALRIDPTKGDTRNDAHIGVQDLFVDKHLWDMSSRYDFDSLRIGIQPFNADFRGFLFRDEQLGIRLFGNRRNNVFLYNVAWFRRVEKDTNSGLNDLRQSLRKDDVFVANLYWQDFPHIGFASELVALYNRNEEGDEKTYFNQNGFIERPASFGLEKPRNYDVLYLGYNGEGHVGRFNLTASAYWLTGSQDQGVFADKSTDISAVFLATEISMDFDWRRIRFNALYSSGDKDPFDDVENGFDAVFENPLFAGADTSFWVRQNVPLIGGGGVAISGRNSVINSLRSSKEEGQSNFTNPGTILLGVGADFDITPSWRLTTNANHISFDTTEVVEAARQQADIPRDLGWDLSVAAIWRPLFNQNIVVRASGAALIPGKGYEALFGDEELPYSFVLNMTFTY